MELNNVKGGVGIRGYPLPQGVGLSGKGVIQSRQLS